MFRITYCLVILLILSVLWTPISAQNCTRGYTTNGNSLCIPCSLGSYKDTFGPQPCSPCPVDTFSDTSGAAECTPCANGTSTVSQTNSSACASCAVGYGGTAPDCFPCAEGYKKDQAGNGNCEQNSSKSNKTIAEFLGVSELVLYLIISGIGALLLGLVIAAAVVRNVKSRKLRELEMRNNDEKDQIFAALQQQPPVQPSLITQQQQPKSRISQQYDPLTMNSLQQGAYGNSMAASSPMGLSPQNMMMPMPVYSNSNSRGGYNQGIAGSEQLPMQSNKVYPMNYGYF